MLDSLGMTQANPTVLLLLDASAERTRYCGWLQANSSWQGTVLARNRDDLVTVLGDASGIQPCSHWLADIVVLDESIYQSFWGQIQRFWQASQVVFLVLLETTDEAFAATVLAAGAHDYLVKSQLNCTRLGQTITFWGHQVHLQQALQSCRQNDVFQRATVGINETDESGQFIRVNQYFCDLLGYSAAELLQRNYRDITHPDDLDRQIEQEQQLLCGAIDRTTLEKRYLTKGDRIIWTRMTLSVIHNADDGSIRVLAVVEDIGHYKQVEAELNTQKNLLRAFLDNVPHIAWLKDREGRFITVNAAFGESCGFSPEALTGKTDLDIWPTELAHAYRDDDFAVIASKQQKRVVEPLVASDGAQQWINTIKTPIFNDAGEVVGTVGIAIDITEFKRLEQALRDSQAKLADVLDNSRACITRIRLFPDASWECDYYSPGSEAIYGYPPEMLQTDAHLWRSRVLEEDYETVIIPTIQAILAGQLRNTVEYRFRHRDGSLRWISESCAAHWEEPQQCWILTTVGIDVSDRKYAELALRDSESRYATLTESAPVGIFRFDAQGECVYVNPRWCELTGRTPEEGYGDDWIEVLHPDDRDRLLTSWAEALAQQSVFRAEGRHLLKNGTVIWFDCQMVPEFNDTGELLGYIGTVSDITSRKEAELALQASEARYRQLVDNIPNGAVQIFDRTLRVNYIGGQILSELGLSAEALLGVHPWEILAEDQWRRIEPLTQRALAGESVVGEVQYGNLDLLISLAPLRNAAGQIDGMMSVAQNITDRKQAEMAIAQESLRRKTLFDTSVDGIVILDMNGQVLEANASFATMLGYGPEEVTQLTLRDFDANWSADEIEQKIAEADFCLNTFETRHRRRDGSVFDVEISTSQITWEGALVQFCICRDISDRKAAEAALQASEERLRTALEAAQMGSWDWNLDTNEIIWSESLERLMGLEPGTFDGQLETVVAMIHPGDRPLVAEAISHSIEQDAPYDIEFRFIKPNGSVRWAASKGRVVRDATGRAIRMTGLDVDITDRKAAEAQVWEVTQRLQLATDAAQLGIWDFNLQEDRLLWDDRMYELYGLEATASTTSASATIHDTWERNIHPDDRAGAVACFQDAVRGNAEFHSEFRVVWPDGQVRYIEAHALILRDAEGRAQRMIGVNWDITARKQAEQALQQINEQLEERVQQRTEELARSEQDLRTIFNNVYDAIFIHDADGTVLDVNERAMEISHATREQLIGIKIPDCSGPGAPIETVVERLRHAQAGETLCFEWKNRRFDDNTSFDTEVTVRQIFLNNRLVMLSGVRDISDRKAAERALRASERRYATLTDVAPVAIFRFDAPLNCTYASDYWSQLTGRSPEEALGQGWINALHPEERDRLIAEWLESVERLSAGQAIANGREGRHLRPDGSVNWYYIQMAAEYDDTGEMVGYIGALTDITERKRAEQQLEAERLRLQVALDAAQMGTWESNLETGFWSERTEAIFGYAPGTFPGDREAFLKLVHPDDQVRVFTALSTSFTDQTPYRADYRIYRLDGEVRWVSVNGTVVENADGSDRRIIGVAQDITDRKQAEEALRDSEERLRLALNASQQGLYDLDLLTGEAIVSVNYVSMLGYEPDTFHETNSKWLERLHPDDHERVRNTFLAYMAGDIPEYKVEFRQRTKSGQWKWILSIGKVVSRDETGQPLRMLGVHLDIDEQKKAEEAVRASETRFRQIAENIKEVFWLATPDHEILYVSPAYEQVWGRSPDDVTAESFLATVYPEDRDRLHARPDPVYENYPHDFLSGSTEIEYRIVRPDGTIRWIRDRAFPVMNKQGQIVRIAGVAEDITERKQLEQEQARLLNILEAAPDHIGVATPDGVVIWNNRQAKLIRGLPLDVDVTQISISTYHPAWALQIIQEEGFPTAMRDGIWFGETALLTSNNEELPVSQLILAHKSATGEVEYLSTIIRDISRLKQAEQALLRINAELEGRVAERTAELVEAKDAAEAANQAKSTFLANMSHELRTPLNAILGFSQIVGRDQSLSSKHLDALKIINRSGEHLLTLINDILEMSKIEAGQVVLAPTNFELSQILDSLADMLRLKAEAKGLNFTIRCHPHIPRYIRTDSHKLRQVLLNLLSNAIKFTRLGYVVLRVEPGPPPPPDTEPLSRADSTNLPVRALRFEVEDSGSGIAPDELDLLFEPFVQTASGRQSQEGTGLGLPISRQFVHLLGGSLRVSSVVGQGSTFMFEIPVQIIEVEAVEPIALSQKAIALAPDQPRYRILVVEDNWANRVLLQTLLTDLGFEVQLATNGREAIEFWQAWQPHLIFMDIRMPEMNGYDAAQEIRRLEQSMQGATGGDRPTKIISLTAGVLTESQPEYTAAGFDGFIAKPIQETVITQSIAQHLGVCYRYTDDLSSPDTLPGTHRPLTEDALRSLPLDWLRQFHTILTRLNQTEMLEHIAHLPPDQNEIGQLLRQKVQDFDYEVLLNWIQAILG